MRRTACSSTPFSFNHADTLAASRWLLLLLVTLSLVTIGESSSTAVRLVNIHPHNVSAFTEGLVFDDGALIESTGLNGESFIRKYQLSDLQPTYFQAGVTKSVPYLQEFRFDSTVFGEGVTVLGDKLYALTYKKQQVLVLSRRDFQLLDQFPLVTTSGEGWGLTTDGEFLIASDGSATIQFFDPRDEFALHHNITVRKDGVPVTKVNELEYVEGELLANIWFENYILRIDIGSGDVLEQIDLDWMPNMVANIHSKAMLRSSLKADAVMNGIAYDPASHHLFLTGKLWDSMFELELSYLNSHQQAIVP